MFKKYTKLLFSFRYNFCLVHTKAASENAGASTSATGGSKKIYEYELEFAE